MKQKNKKCLTISKSRFLSFLGRQRLHGLQIKVVIQMQIIQILSVNQQIEHIVALSTHLQTRFDPIECGRLKEFRRLERTEKIAFFLRLRSAMLECVENVIFEKFLIADANFDGIAGRTVLTIPAFDEGNVNGATTTTRTHVERTRCPQQGNSVGGVVGVERRVLQEGLNFVGQNEFFVIVRKWIDAFDAVTMSDWINEGVEVEGRKVGILGLDVDHVGGVVPMKWGCG